MSSTLRIGLATLILFLCPSLSGSAHIEAVAPLFAVLLLFTGLGTFASDQVRYSHPTILFGLLGLLFVSALQWVPLPKEIISTISKETYTALVLSYRDLPMPAYLPLSLDPTLSFHRWVQLATLFLFALWLSQSGTFRDKGDLKSVRLLPVVVF